MPSASVVKHADGNITSGPPASKPIRPQPAIKSAIATARTPRLYAEVSRESLRRRSHVLAWRWRRLDVDGDVLRIGRALQREHLAVDWPVGGAALHRGEHR